MSAKRPVMASQMTASTKLMMREKLRRTRFVLIMILMMTFLLQS
jgi:hypothetical protein